MTTDNKIAIVCNPQAGKGKAVRLSMQLQQQLSHRNIYCNVFEDQWPESFSGFTKVFIIGGDGTMNYFINKYPHIEIPLALFKGGSGNDFAWKLYGDISPEKQLDIVLTAQPVAVDAGICNGTYFLNGVGIGFDGEVVKAMGKKRFLSASYLSYLWTVLKKVSFYREKYMRIQFNGNDLKEKLFMISIANGSRYGGGFMVAPQAKITDGLLDVVTIYCIRPLSRFFYLPKVQKGTHLHLPFVQAAHTKKITICSSQTMTGHIDGELAEATIFNVEILPGKYLFLC
jgi:YegS/Rv2252/BmrU family lipid kinase